MQKGVVFWSKSNGLANRLRALVGYQALASCLDAPFHLCWTPDLACEADFAQLFSLSQIDLITSAVKDALEREGVATIYTSTSWYDEIWRAHLVGIVSWEVFCDRALSYARRLMPVPLIMQEILSFAESRRLQKTSAVHVRMTDNLEDYGRFAKMFPDFDLAHISKIEGFYRFIESELKASSDAHIFLATDNADVEHRMLSRFAGRIVVYPKSYLNISRYVHTSKGSRINRERTSSIQDAVIEMFLLSRCRIIAGTYYSSYGKFGAVLGNASFVEVRGDRYAPSYFVEMLQGKSSPTQSRDRR